MNLYGSTLSAKFIGGLVGTALGDAIGQVTTARMDRANLCATVELIDTLAYGDETAMTIGLAQALLAEGELSEQLVGDQLRHNYSREPWRGYRPGPPTVFTLVEQQGLSYAQAAARLGGGASANDNGAATRIAPLALYLANAPDLYAQAALSARVTHAHPVAIDGAAVMAKAIASLLSLFPATPCCWQPWLQELITFAQTALLRKQLQCVAELFASHLAPKFAFDYLGAGSAVQTSLPFALYAFLSHPASFADCLCCAVTHGGERDALGAMAGALTGAYLGCNAIPSSWQLKLEKQADLAQLACQLAVKATFTPRQPRPLWATTLRKPRQPYALLTTGLGTWN